MALGAAELPANPEHLRHHGVSRQTGGAGASEHPSGGRAAVLGSYSLVSPRLALHHEKREYFTKYLILNI